MERRRLHCDDLKTLTRSRVTNGKSIFIDLVDGRSAHARRFKDIYEQVCVDRGGVDRLSEAEQQLIKRGHGSVVSGAAGSARSGGGADYRDFCL